MSNVEAIATNPVPVECLAGTRVYKIMERLNATNKVGRSDADFVARWLNNNEIFDDAIPYFGWRFNFSVFMRVFEMRLKKGKRKVYGFDKQSVKKSFDSDIEDNMILETS